MESIKKAMLAMKNEKDAATDTADQLENTYLEKKDEKEKVCWLGWHMLSSLQMLLQN